MPVQKAKKLNIIMVLNCLKQWHFS